MSSSTSESGSSSMPTSTESGGGGGGGSSETNTETATVTASARALFGRRFTLFPRQDEGGGNGSSGSNSSSGGSDSNPQPYAGVWPNVTLGRTLLNSSSLVMLEGNKSQVLAWTRSSPEGNVTILNQAYVSHFPNILFPCSLILARAVKTSPW